MPQEQHSIDIRFLDGKVATAIRTGNNAAWMCACERRAPLLGYSSSGDPPGENAVVVCPDCGRRFQVVAPTNRAVPTHVREI
jgi:hypothetical protein